jgi:LysM repeat protein
MTRRRLPILALLGINVVVAAVTTSLVLLIWDSRRQPETIVLPTFSGASAQSGASPDSAPSGETAGESPVSGDEGEPQAPTEGGEEGAPPPAEAAESQNVIHVVQAGDTLFQLALEYDVTVEDIVIANNLESEEALLALGQELVIPIGGLPPTPTPTVPAPTSTLELTPIATVTPLPPGTISVVVQDVLFPGDVTREAVVIVNQGSTLDLEGWSLSDEDGNEYVFPTFKLFGNGSAVTVYTGVGEDNASELYWGRSTAVWGEASDTVILRSPSGDVQSEFPIEQ